MFRVLLYPLLAYRSFLLPFLVVSAVVVPCWLLFRLYRRRIRGHRPTLLRELLLLTFVVYLSGVASATLTPNRSSRLVAQGTGGIELRPDLTSLTCSSATLPAGTSAPRFCGHNARGNVALFVPLGLLVPLVWTRMRFWRGIQVAIALSFGIEVAQYLSSAWGSYRAADVNDLILNVAGASLGLGVIALLRLRRPPTPEVARA